LQLLYGPVRQGQAVLFSGLSSSHLKEEQIMMMFLFGTLCVVARVFASSYVVWLYHNEKRNEKSLVKKAWKKE
jgi:hypothetical protein